MNQSRKIREAEKRWIIRAIATCPHLPQKEFRASKVKELLEEREKKEEQQEQK